MHAGSYISFTTINAGNIDWLFVCQFLINGLKFVHFAVMIKVLALRLVFFFNLIDISSLIGEHAVNQNFIYSYKLKYETIKHQGKISFLKAKQSSNACFKWWNKDNFFVDCPFHNCCGVAVKSCNSMFWGTLIVFRCRCLQMSWFKSKVKSTCMYLYSWLGIWWM